LPTAINNFMGLIENSHADEFLTYRQLKQAMYRQGPLHQSFACYDKIKV
jgi:hypothetical protein